jgi:hypothetical protein
VSFDKVSQFEYTVLDQMLELERLVQSCAQKLVNQKQRLEKGEPQPHKEPKPSKDLIEELHEVIIQKHYLSQSKARGNNQTHQELRA